MNSKYFLTPAIAILGIALVGYTETTRTTGVVTVGPIMPTVRTPRVRVANDRAEPVDVWFVPDGEDALRRLGSVGALGAGTFTLPDAVRAMRIVIQPLGTSAAPHITNNIQVDAKTDVSLLLSPIPGCTTLEVAEIETASPRTKRPSKAMESTTPNG